MAVCTETLSIAYSIALRQSALLYGATFGLIARYEVAPAYESSVFFAYLGPMTLAWVCGVTPVPPESTVVLPASRLLSIVFALTLNLILISSGSALRTGSVACDHCGLRTRSAEAP